MSFHGHKLDYDLACFCPHLRRVHKKQLPVNSWMPPRPCCYWVRCSPDSVKYCIPQRYVNVLVLQNGCFTSNSRTLGWHFQFLCRQSKLRLLKNWFIILERLGFLMSVLIHFVALQRYFRHGKYAKSFPLFCSLFMEHNRSLQDLKGPRNSVNIFIQPRSIHTCL